MNTLKENTMYYRIKFILKDLLVSPIVMFWKQILISMVLAGIFTLIIKPEIYVFLTAVGICFLASLMVTMANDSYNRQKEKLLETLKDKR